MIHSQQVAIREAIQQHGFKRLLLAVSGGLDSICLAHYFVTNKDALDIEWLGIAHVNHGLRAGSADLDEKLVRDFAAANGIPFFCAHLEGATLKSAEGSLEENARDARYDALRHFAEEALADAILTAHHAGDQAETMYMRLHRGVTLAGLHGIQEIRCLGDRTPSSFAVDERRKDFNKRWLVSSKQDNQSQDTPTSHEQGADTSSISSSNLSSIVPPRGTCALSDKSPSAARFRQSSILYRPFLSITREELHEYAIANSLSWCEDESNSDTKFTRNKIRHLLLPNLEQQQPGATAQLCRIASHADKVYRKVIKIADNLFAPAIVPPEKWPFEASLSPYKKVLALDENTLKTTFDKLAEATKSDTQKQGMQEIFRLWLDSRGFRFPTGAFSINVTKSSINKPQRGPDECQEPRPHTSYLIPSFSFRTRSIETCRHIIWIYDTREIQVSSNLYFSNEKQRFSGVPGLWRHPQESDVLSPMDMKIKARKLATWLQEKSIPHWIRDFLQVYAQDSKVLFVSGIRNKKFDT